MKLSALAQQKTLALALLDWHDGQSSALYAVGSCMLSASMNGKEYRPADYHGHSCTGTECGETCFAVKELRNLRKDANFPEAVTVEAETECNTLADTLAEKFTCKNKTP